MVDEMNWFMKEIKSKFQYAPTELYIYLQKKLR